MGGLILEDSARRKDRYLPMELAEPVLDYL
jgi:hypothetical protein